MNTHTFIQHRHTKYGQTFLLCENQAISTGPRVIRIPILSKSDIMPVLNIFKILTNFDEYIIAIGRVVDGMALDIAKRYKAKVLAFYVSIVPTSIRRAAKYLWDEMYNNNLEQVSKWLKDITDETKDDHIDLKIEIRETESSIATEIIKKADEYNADLIVLGSTGKSKFERLLLGSVAQGVMTYAKCSVLVIR